MTQTKKRTKSELIRIAVFSDLHIQNMNKHYKTDQDGRGDLNKRQELFINHLASIDCDVYLNLGDSTDEEIVDPHVLSVLNHMLLGPIADTASLFINLEGNHCITDSGNIYSILAAYKDKVKENVRLTVDKENDIVLNVAGKTIYIRSVPYYGDYQVMREMITKPLDNAYNDFSLLLYHAPTANALMDNGLPATKGLEFEDDDLDQYDLALAGDFHRPQGFMVGSTPAYYCGAPFALTRGQNFDLGYRILVIYDDGTFELEDHANPFAVKIIDTEYGSKLPADLSQTTLYINNVPYAERKNLSTEVAKHDPYIFKLKVAPIEAPERIAHDSEVIKAHKQNDLYTLYSSVLTEDEKADPWITNLLDSLINNS